MVRKSFKWYAGGFWLPHIHLNRSYRDHLFRFLFKDKRDLLEKCRRLEEYSEFVSRIYDALSKGMSLKRAIETAMDSCIEEGILKEVLIRQRTEVMHMLLTEFDEKKYKKSVYQDGYEDGVREGEISGFYQGRRTQDARTYPRKSCQRKSHSHHRRRTGNGCGDSKAFSRLTSPIIELS